MDSAKERGMNLLYINIFSKFWSRLSCSLITVCHCRVFEQVGQLGLEFEWSCIPSGVISLSRREPFSQALPDSWISRTKHVKIYITSSNWHVIEKDLLFLNCRNLASLCWNTDSCYQIRHLLSWHKLCLYFFKQQQFFLSEWTSCAGNWDSHHNFWADIFTSYTRACSYTTLVSQSLV